MIIYHIFFFHHLHKPIYLFPISLTSKYSFILHFRILNNLFKYQDSLHVLVLCKVFKCYLLLLEKVTIYKKKKEEKKKKRRKYEKEEKKKTKRKKERKKRRRKRKRRIRKSEKKEKYGKTISSYLYPSIPLHSYHVYIHVTTPHHLYQFYLSFSTIIIHIIWGIIKHQWYLS